MKQQEDIFIFDGCISKEKYKNNNYIARILVRKFMQTVLMMAKISGSSSFLEVGCGEGHICGLLAKNGFKIKGLDISKDAIDVARSEALKNDLDILFFEKSIYDLDPVKDREQTIICCEVLEHLEEPGLAIKKIFSIAEKNVILSVPNEPLWRILNIMRGKYISDFGNTTGHIQHWSKKDIINFVSKYAKVIVLKSPIPWTIMLCESLKK